MSTASKAVLLVLLLAGVAMLVRRAGFASAQAALPKDMPSGSTFAASGFNPSDNEPRGQWIACREQQDETSNWCRITDQSGIVVYEGSFLPVGQRRPAAAVDLQIAAFNPLKNWTKGPAESRPVPVIPLRNGLLLVPAADSDVLAERWAKYPAELTAFRSNIITRR